MQPPDRASSTRQIGSVVSDFDIYRTANLLMQQHGADNAKLFAANPADRLLAKADLERGLQHPLAGSPVPSSTSSLAARQQIRPDVSNSGSDAVILLGRAPHQRSGGATVQYALLIYETSADFARREQAGDDATYFGAWQPANARRPRLCSTWRRAGSPAFPNREAESRRHTEDRPTASDMLPAFADGASGRTSKSPLSS